MAKVNFTAVSVKAIEGGFSQAPRSIETPLVDSTTCGAARKTASMKIRLVGGYWTVFVPDGRALMSFPSLEAGLDFAQGFLVEVMS